MAKKPPHSVDDPDNAALFRNGRAVVVAAAGSGKTTLIKDRYRALLKQGVEPGAMLLLSHSRRAAGALASVNLRQTTRNAYTVHGLCHRILREFYKEAALEADFAVADTTWANSLLEAAIIRTRQEMGALPIKLEGLRSYISLRRSGLLSHERARELSGFPEPAAGFLKAISEGYRAKKKKAGVIDFDDLLHLTYRLLKINAGVRKKLRGRYRHIMVDEAQDLSPAQLRIITRIFGKWQKGQKRSLMFVGDPGQSIYSFHGANYDYLRKLADDSTVKSFPLDTNHRSTQRIIALANAVDISDFKGRSPTKAAPKAELGKLPALTIPVDAKAEAHIICKLIRKNKKQGFGYSSQAILLRTSEDFHFFEVALAAADIPFRSVGGGFRKKGPAITETVINIFHVAQRPDDVERLRKTLGIASKKMCRRASSREALLKRSRSLPAFEAETVKGLLRCIKWAADEQRPVKRRLNDVLKALQPLFSSDDGDPSADSEKAAIAHLKALAEESSDARDFLSSYALDPALLDASDKTNAVTLSTIHGAKGLEWDAVYLPQLQEGHLPHRRSRQIDEERRLLYVAVTRARKRLYLSYPAGLTLYGRALGRPCRFISDPKVSRHLDTKF